MDSLLTKVKNAKITSREVLIHLRKNGEIKRKSYLKYLKMQYHLSGDAYRILLSASNNFENTLINTKSPNVKTPIMPVHLTKSELSKMSHSFEDTSFLTEAWHFFQKNMMINLSGKPTVHSKSELDKPSGFISTTNIKHTEELIWNNNDTPVFKRKSSFQTNTQTLKIRPPASSFGTLSKNYRDPLKSTPLCIQVLKWAQEGRLILN